MTEIERNCLIEFFNSINEKFEYVVLRNANELPYENFSNDIDILVDENHYEKFNENMERILYEHGFTRVEIASTYGLECRTFYNLNYEFPITLKIDLFFNLDGGGLTYYTFEDLNKLKVKNDNNIYVFDNKTEAFITALKVLSVGGKLKDKYLNNLIENKLASNSVLIKKCPSKEIISIINETYEKKENISQIPRKKFIYETFIYNIKRNPFLTLKKLTVHYVKEIKRLLKKQYFFVFVGPDGSGKTTLMTKLISDSKKYLRSNSSRISTFHHRPHLFKNISDLFKKNVSIEELEDRIHNPHNGKQSSGMVSFIKTLYYSIDYRLGFILKILPLQHKNQFIIFDRYFFDFIVDQKRSAVKLNKFIVKLIYKVLIPKPNKVFFIKVDPTEAHNRKNELPINEIKSINDKYELLTKEFNYFKVIHNDNLDHAYQNLLKEFIITITEKNYKKDIND